MDIFLYILIFITGTFFGSFFTLAVYRIPNKEDILIKHSYCPNCNHKLGFFDLFPVLSYLVLKGKCRYCGDKIRPRYLILELLSGFTFLLITFSIKISFNNINEGINLLILLLYLSILFIIAGIDKEKVEIPLGLVLTGYSIEIIYIIYQCTLNNINVYQYVIYLIFLLAILIISNINLKICLCEKYYTKILYLSLYMIIYGGSRVYILTVILTLIMIAIYLLLNKRKNRLIPIGFYLSVSNIIVLITCNFVINYII